MLKSVKDKGLYKIVKSDNIASLVFTIFTVAVLGLDL